MHKISVSTLEFSVPRILVKLLETFFKKFSKYLVCYKYEYFENCFIYEHV